MSQACPNQLLALLPQAVLQTILKHTRIIHLRAGQELDPPETTAMHTYFPESTVLALSLILSDSATTEVMTVGQEGMLTPMGHSDGQTNLHAHVLLPGTALRLPQTELRKLAESHPILRLLLDAYTNSTLSQLYQVIACYRHHSVRQQLSRCLLDIDDRLPNQPIVITHAALAARLGVRREAISSAASVLRRKGALQYHRGVIERIERPRLLPFSCECYHALKALRQKKTQPVWPGPK